MPLHDDELAIDVALVRSLLAQERADWVDLPVTEAGAGTDNRMFRLGEDLLVRMPRTVEKARSLRKERLHLPRLARSLTIEVPEPMHAGAPSLEYPVEWAVYRWIDGDVPDDRSVADWGAFGTDLAGFVRELHDVDLGGAERAGELSWYRGGSLRDPDSWIRPAFGACRSLVGDELDVDTLESWWLAALALPDPTSQVWLHGDLRPGNLLARSGRLCAVIDFGALSVGFPDAEHAAVWDLPWQARASYWNMVGLSDEEWLRARAWAIGVAVVGIPYYWHSFPEFVAECRSRLGAILDAASTAPKRPAAVRTRPAASCRSVGGSCETARMRREDFRQPPVVAVGPRDDAPRGDRGRWPATIPAVGQRLDEGLKLSAGVTFLVGENGSGKSTLLEAVAMAYGFSGEGGSTSARHSTRRSESDLADRLSLQRGIGAPRWGYFLRAETMHSFYTYLEENPSARAEPVFHEMSHGESFLAILDTRFDSPGFYCLDEPEAALSFSSTLTLISTLNRIAADGGQVLCATHSPILASLPGATIIEVGEWGMRRSRWEDLELVAHWRSYLSAPERYLRHLLD